MHSNLNLEDRTTSITSSSTNTATPDPYGPRATLSVMPTRENIQVNGKLPLHSTVDKLPLHSTVEPQTAGPARETAPKISRLEPPAVPPRETAPAPKISKLEPPDVPPRETAPRVPEFKPPNVYTRDTAPKVSEFEPPTIPLAAFVSLLLYTQSLPYAMLNPEGLLLPELEALQYKESTPLKKSVSQLTNQMRLEALQYK
jgi:hypothetical protein